MNPYPYLPPNLPANMVQSYLQRSYQSGVDQELLLLSQMYSNFQSGGSTAGYGALNALFNSASGATNSPYNSTNATSNYYNKPNTPSITTSSPSGYSNISSNVFNGIGQLSSSPSSSSAAAAAAAQYNLTRYLPSFSSNSSPITSSFPFNMYNTSSGSASNTNSAQSSTTNQPGPNAIKNPLLSNLLPPSKDSFSIPTSVITKASKDVQRPNASIGPSVSLSPTSVSTNVMNQTSNQKSAHSSNSGSIVSKGPSMVSRVSTLASARGSPSIARSSPSIAARNSPSLSRSSPSLSRSSPSISRSSPSIAARSSPSITPRSQAGGINITPTPRSISSAKIPSIPSTSRNGSSEGGALMVARSSLLTNARVSPSIVGRSGASIGKTAIGVKDVNAINRTIEQKSATPAPPKPLAQPIKNFNMGIVYPKDVPVKKVELTSTEKMIKVVGNRLNHVKNDRISFPKVVVAPQQSSTPKNHLSPNLPTNEVTITPTKRRVPLPMTANNAHKLATSTKIMPSTSQKTAIEINKLNNSALSVSRLPSSTSITRQIPTAISSNNANKIVSRLPNPTKAIPSRPVSMPTLKLISKYVFPHSLPVDVTFRSLIQFSISVRQMIREKENLRN